MDKNKIMQGVSNLYRTFLGDKTTRLSDWIAFKSMIYEYIIQTTNAANGADKELANNTYHIHMGMLKVLNMVEEQYHLSKKDTII